MLTLIIDSAQKFVDLLPSWKLISLLSLLHSQHLDIQIPPSGVEINFLQAYEFRSLPQLVNNVKANDNRCCQVSLKEVRQEFTSGHAFIPDGTESSPELSNEDKYIHT